MTLIARQALAGGLLLAASGAIHAAPIYNYTDSTPRQNSSGGTLSSIDTTYDQNTQTFSWSYTVEDPANNTHNGFWLVVNDGPLVDGQNGNPKGSDRFLAILYGDLIEKDVTAYVYNGQNNPGSYAESSGFLGTFVDALTVTDYSGPGNTGTRDVSFSINVASINQDRPTPNGAPDWQGVRFDDSLGIWFHSTSGSGSPATYGPADLDGNRQILTFAQGESGWIDTGSLETTVIPEPGVLSLAGMGLLAFGFARRRSRRQA